MEQTLGKRIIENRKRLGLTQDRLAEQLGVTAQAVSKWENDQSCPDITMLPRLAEIFGTSTDTLLGIDTRPVIHETELVKEENEPDGLHIDNGTWELKYDGGKKSGIGLAVWVLLTGGLLFISNLLRWPADIWDIAWPSGLLIFGLWGLFPKFSMLRLACGLFGGYNLLLNLGLISHIGRNLLLPILLLLFGISLLIDALKKNRQPSFQLSHDGRVIHNGHKKFSSSCTVEGESFACSTAFGSDHPQFQMERMSCGSAEVTFGELMVDLSGCREIGENAAIKADCSFGSLQILVPRKWRAELFSSTAFASAEVIGEAARDAEGLIQIHCDVSFGEIRIQYI